MDAVELGYPVDVPNLMGSEGFGRAGVTVNEVETAAACESNSRVSIIVNTSIERCSTFLRQKDVTSTVNDLEPASWDNISENELCKHESQPSNFPVKESSEQIQRHSRDTNCPSSNSRSDVVQVQRKAGKLSRSSTRCSKRPRLAQLEGNMCLAGVDNTKNISDSLGTYHTTTCTSLEKTQMAKQKNNSSGKRGDKRNCKVPMKVKYDSLCTKTGLASLGSAAGGNNFFGGYGLKSDFYDITKHLDDISLKDLLDGTYECPSLGKDKGRRAVNWNGNFLDSIRKACFILPIAKPSQFQNFAETDSSINKKLLICTPSSTSSVSTGDKGHSCATNRSPCDKDSCTKPGTPVNLPDLQLYQPKDILERITLSPPKDLEALLLDAAKPSSCRTNSDMRSGKQISCRASLPPFSWSHTFSGHSRTNTDSVKLLTNRSTCQGQWARIAASATSLGPSTNCFTNLESLNYDQSLVPASTSISRPWCDQGSSSVETCSKESGINFKAQVNDVHCSIVLAAAQTLCYIATQSSRINPEGIMRLPKKPSQKSMKARKSKVFKKPEEVFTTRIPQLVSDNPLRSGAYQITSSNKRFKLAEIENGKDLNHNNGIKKGPINFSTSRSSKSSPNKMVRDSIADTRHSTANVLQQSCMLPPPAKVSDKAWNSQHKPRKIIPPATGWDSRGRDSLD